ncbi:MAG: hypothetical protein QOJ53_983 [Sphingomonadales bacterium]|jgi:hypothetical protein|nr:hypothetical protein [Sphingomonadales bacterium]
MASLVGTIETKPYLAAAERLMSEERAAIVDTIAANPEGGVVIPGTGGLRKLRIPLGGHGKRGGGRVIYWYRSQVCPVVLLFVFAKNEAEDLASGRRKQLMRIADALNEEFGDRT